MASAAKTITPIDNTHPDIVRFLGESKSGLAVAEAYIIDSREMYDIAAQQLTDIRRLEKDAETARTTITGPLNVALKNTNALFKPIAAACDRAKRMLGAKMVAYEDAERARVRAAEQAALEEQRRATEAAEAKLAEAAEAMSKGDMSTEEFESVAGDAMAAAVSVPVSHVEAPPERGGHARRDRWTAEVEDLPAFLIHLAGLLRKGDPTFDNTVDIKIGQLNKFADATQGSVPIPGVKYTKQSTLAARS